MRTRIKKAIQEALNGSHWIEITFKVEPMPTTMGVRHIIDMYLTNDINIHINGLRDLFDIVRSGKLSLDTPGRVIDIGLGPDFNETWFIERMCDYLEDIKKAI
ncbi:MAG: hypothetical protein A2469_01960 [Candidatus Magasanikbacteria bacterium RIFOXYC2_FULL_40_16]|uniref:Uncharacterized protein n=3 Tax=Candidatus Magasanikiibacteriota TaxID=1752731 RepID=A0A1F6NH07_9BACT|nr:MAG: hypothetical protein A2373_04590 [Candidatus Magasanikbacteria bacterium RIFOXYB1_FULL_40_15]OGH87852.1 MAG: hypothetical protein A2206_04015 [Candidatus Magasanikbacteria bacterium RIFOXYA1_FULL_40_8]OGH89577.1 MAG: hypothetical protein A2469_01960 [Candidatus Magasanikbacteria bacterium RIFOXYC2_FULL_40_16]